jgi:hypothetical protein
MPIAEGDIVQFKQFQTMSGQTILNVFNYQVGGGTIAEPSAYNELAKGFFTLASEQIRAQQNVGISHVRCIVEELGALEYGDFVPPVPLPGTVAGESLPVFNAVSVQYVRSSKITRHGWKRFAGVPETFSSGNALTPGAITAWNAIILNLMNPAGITVDQYDVEDNIIGEVFMRPVIVGQPVPPSDLIRIQVPASVAVRPNLTTQNTRKIGRGS